MCAAAATLWPACSSQKRVAAKPGDGKLNIRGKTYQWDNDRKCTVPLGTVTITVLRDDTLLKRKDSDANGDFSFEDLTPGTPVVILCEKRGYTQGVRVAARGDEGEVIENPVLLLLSDSKNMWNNKLNKLDALIREP